jgi:hypothetical protein
MQPFEYYEMDVMRSASDGVLLDNLQVLENYMRSIEPQS